MATVSAAEVDNVAANTGNRDVRVVMEGEETARRAKANSRKAKRTNRPVSNPDY